MARVSDQPHLAEVARDWRSWISDGDPLPKLMGHRIEEYARHCGDADLLRERIDGRVGQ